MDDLPEHVRRNRDYWDKMADQYTAPGRRNWSTPDITWGIWRIAESDVHLLPEDVSGMDVIELGCGTGYVSAWLARRGAKPVGIDNSPEQLNSARGFQQEFGIEFPLMLGNAEARAAARRIASTSPFPSTARRCGPTLTAGFPRRRVCCGPAGG